MDTQPTTPPARYKEALCLDHHVAVSTVTPAFVTRKPKKQPLSRTSRQTPSFGDNLLLGQQPRTRTNRDRPEAKQYSPTLESRAKRVLSTYEPEPLRHR